MKNNNQRTNQNDNQEVTQKGKRQANQTELRKKSKWLKRLVVLGSILVVLTVAFLLLKAWLFPPYETPVGSGEYAVLEQLYTWEDESRIETFTDTGENRALTVKIWYPETEGTYPLIIFSHGAFGVIESNYSTCVELASHGYVVAAIGHPYHAMFVEDVHGKKTYVDMDFMQRIYADNGEHSEEAERAVYEFSLEWMAVRTGDMHFVLDTILKKAEAGESAPFTLIDADKIGLFGHSMGGATSVQIGRERNDIDAVIDLEGTMAGEYVGFDNGYELYNETPYPVPLLDVNSDGVRADIEQLMTEHSGWEYVNDYVGRNALDYREVIFKDAGHLNFTDLPLFSPVLAGLLGVGEVDAEECINNVNEMVLIFFDYYLKGEGSLSDIKTEY